MKNRYRFLTAAVFALALAVGAQAQRTVSEPAPSKGSSSVSTPKPPPAPASVKAKYEGGYLGARKSEGTLNFDDVNRRLVFRDKQGKETLSMSYDVVFAAWPDTQSRRRTAGTVIANTAPFGLGLPALLWKKEHRYLILQYRDPDTNAEGTTTFKLENKETLSSVLYTFAEKAGLTQRGDAFIRRTSNTSRTQQTSNPE